jgi:RNA polymerase sigma-70 factor (ECF subfamily)
VADTGSNETRFRRIFDEHFDAVSRYCHRRLPTADANDATAEVFTVAWRRIDAVPRGDETLPWLYGVARNQVRSSRRSVRRATALRTRLNGQARHPEPGPEVVVVRNAEQVELLAALAKLRPDDQEVLRLRANEELSLPEIALVLGCSHEAAKKRSARAMKRLRRVADLSEPHGAIRGFPAIQEGGDV